MTAARRSFPAAMGRRTGFTLIELSVSILVASLITAAALGAYFGMQKAQGNAITTNLLRTAGQRAMDKMFKDLSQCRKLIASQSTDSSDVGKAYFNTLIDQAGNFGSNASPIAQSVRVFPKVKVDGGLGVQGASGAVNAGELDPTLVGNTLLFAVQDTPLSITNSALIYTVALGSSTVGTSNPATLSTYRFVSYFLTTVPLPTGTSPFKIFGVTSSYTYQLARWQSGLYVERSEFDHLMSNFLNVGPLSPKVSEWNDLNTNKNVTAIWDSSATDPAKALFTVDATGTEAAVPTPSIPMAKEEWAVPNSLTDGYAISMVAFNRCSGFNIPFLDVPAYALNPNAPSNLPFGFEVAMVGPSSARTVLIRLALAARLYGAGMTLTGTSAQEVVKVVDM